MKYLGDARYRGRTATRGGSMEGLREVLWRTYLRCDEDRLLAVAAGVTFFTILALFPGISAFVALYGMIADRAALAVHLSLVADIAPPSAYAVITGQIEWVMRKGSNELGIAFAVSFGLALWSANAGMKAVMDALNVAYEEYPIRRDLPEQRAQDSPQES